MKKATIKLPETTTPENIGMTHQTAIKFGNKVLFAKYYYYNKDNNGYIAAVYEFTTKNHECDGAMRLTAQSTEFFEDCGHAIQWAMNH